MSDNTVYVVSTFVDTGRNDTKTIGVYESTLNGYKKGYKNGLIDLRGDILELIHCEMLTNDEMKEDIGKIDDELMSLDLIDHVPPPRSVMVKRGGTNIWTPPHSIVFNKCEINMTLMVINR